MHGARSVTARENEDGIYLCCRLEFARFGLDDCGFPLRLSICLTIKFLGWKQYMVAGCYPTSYLQAYQMACMVGFANKQCPKKAQLGWHFCNLCSNLVAPHRRNYLQTRMRPASANPGQHLACEREIFGRGKQQGSPSL